MHTYRLFAAQHESPSHGLFVCLCVCFRLLWWLCDVCGVARPLRATHLGAGPSSAVAAAQTNRQDTGLEEEGVHVPAGLQERH